MVYHKMDKQALKKMKRDISYNFTHAQVSPSTAGALIGAFLCNFHISPHPPIP